MQVDVREVTVEYGGRQVLAGASFAFVSGRSFAVVGPSGSGKSTLLGVIAGVLEPDAGSVTATTEHSLEWLVQSTPLLSRRTVLDNVEMSAMVRANHAADVRRRSLRAMKTVGIDHLKRRLAFSLSGGEKQRVAIARAITGNVDLLLADEPTASLDESNRDQVGSALQSAALSGAIVIVATHDEVLASRCDTVVTLKSGKLEARE